MAVDLNYGIGVEGKNLVLKTLGKVYIKVKDRKYELPFRTEDLRELFEQFSSNSEDTSNSLENNSNVIILDSISDLDNLDYPNDAIIITKDGYLYITENNNYTKIPIKISDDNLDIKNITVSGQITFTGSNIPFIITNNSVINNLNSDLLDGYNSTDFAIKKQDESIIGNWNFNNTQTFENIIVNKNLSDLNKNNLYIDFTTGTIKCNKIITNELNLENQSESQFNLVSGIGQEIWIGAECDIIEKQFTTIKDLEINNFNNVEDAYNNEELPSNNYDESGNFTETWTLEDFWYDKIFFDNWDSETLEYTLKNFSDVNVWNEVNKNFDGTIYNLNQFVNLIYGLQKDTEHSNYTGYYYDVYISENVDIMAIVPNMIFKDNKGNIGYILWRNKTHLIVQMLNEATTLNGDKLIIIGSLCRSGGIVFNANDVSLSILKNPLDKNSYSIYFGELSKIDNTKSGLGMILKASYPKNIVNNNNIESIINYNHTSEINIENCYIKWGNNINVFNEDGSGLISNGQIRWSINNDLSINTCVIENSKILNTSLSNNITVINADGSGNINNKIIWNSDNITLENITINNSYLTDCIIKNTLIGEVNSDGTNPILKNFLFDLENNNLTWNGTFSLNQIPLLSNNKLPTTIDKKILSNCSLDENCVFKGIWKTTNIPTLTNNHIPSTLSNKNLSSCELDCNCIIPDCLLNNRTYKNIIIQNSTIDSTNTIEGVLTNNDLTKINDKFEIFRTMLKFYRQTKAINISTITLNTYEYSSGTLDVADDATDAYIKFDRTIPTNYDLYRTENNIFYISIRYKENRGFNLHLQINNESFSQFNIVNIGSSDWNNSKLENGEVIIDLDQNSAGENHMLVCFILWTYREIFGMLI